MFARQSIKEMLYRKQDLSNSRWARLLRLLTVWSLLVTVPYLELHIFVTSYLLTISRKWKLWNKLAIEIEFRVLIEKGTDWVEMSSIIRKQYDSQQWPYGWGVQIQLIIFNTGISHGSFEYHQDLSEHTIVVRLQKSEPLSSGFTECFQILEFVKTERLKHKRYSFIDRYLQSSN